jgi:membrane dipeptidase
MSRSLHDDALIVDSLMVSNWGPAVFRSIRSGGVTAMNATCAVWENFRETMDNIAQWQQWFAKNSDLVMPVRCTADIAAAKRAAKLGVILGFQNGSPLEDRFEFVRTFKSLGVGVIQITYNNQNFIGSGCYERTDSGLSDFGRIVIDEMNEAGIAIDLSHVGDKTSADAIAHSKKPVCFSHANPRALKEHVRNKSDKLLRALADKDGYVGLNMFPLFMPDRGNSKVDDIIPMLDYVIDLVGEDRVGIGTDLTEGHGVEFWRWICQINGRGSLLLDVPVEQQGMIIRRGEDYAVITAALKRAGYSETRIRKILGLNFIAFLQKAWNEV